MSPASDQLGSQVRGWETHYTKRCYILKVLAVDRKFVLKKRVPHYHYGSYLSLMIVSICPFSYLDPRCMVGRIYGTTGSGCHGFREDFLKFPNPPI